jgi:hypothetical protein
LLTLHEVGKGIFYMRNVPKSHEECNACPQFRVLQLSENRDALPSRDLGDGSPRAQGAAAARPCPDPQLAVRGKVGGGARGWLPVERIGGELRARAALPVDR